MYVHVSYVWVTEGLWAAVWVLRIKPSSSGSSANTLNHEAISPALEQLVLNNTNKPFLKWKDRLLNSSIFGFELGLNYSLFVWLYNRWPYTISRDKDPRRQINRRLVGSFQSKTNVICCHKNTIIIICDLCRRVRVFGFFPNSVWMSGGSLKYWKTVGTIVLIVVANHTVATDLR